MYSLRFTKKALKELSKMDSFVRKYIIGWLEENIEGCADPRAHGKGLSGVRSNEWRYRIGDWRALAIIKDDKVVVEVFKVGHRREVYE